MSWKSSKKLCTFFCWNWWETVWSHLKSSLLKAENTFSLIGCNITREHVFIRFCLNGLIPILLYNGSSSVPWLMNLLIFMVNQPRPPLRACRPTARGSTGDVTFDFPPMTTGNEADVQPCQRSQLRWKTFWSTDCNIITEYFVTWFWLRRLISMSFSKCI